MPLGSSKRVITMRPNSVTPHVWMITGMTIRPRSAAAPKATVDTMVLWIRRLIIGVASPCAQAAVDCDVLTGHIGRCVRDQKQHRAHHLVRAGHPTERDAGAVALLEGLVLSAFHPARSEGIDPHALRAPVGGEMFGQPDNACFGRGVNRRRIDRAPEIFGALVNALVRRHQAVD